MVDELYSFKGRSNKVGTFIFEYYFLKTEIRVYEFCFGNRSVRNFHAKIAGNYRIFPNIIRIRLILFIIWIIQKVSTYGRKYNKWIRNNFWYFIKKNNIHIIYTSHRCPLFLIVVSGVTIEPQNMVVVFEKDTFMNQYSKTNLGSYPSFRLICNSCQKKIALVSD